MLELGGEIGAVILHTNPELHGQEIEISPDGDDHERSHKEVLERSAGGRPDFTAVFDGVRAGTYTLWVGGRAQSRGVKVAGGRITQVDWR